MIASGATESENSGARVEQLHPNGRLISGPSAEAGDNEVTNLNGEFTDSEDATEDLKVFKRVNLLQKPIIPADIDITLADIDIRGNGGDRDELDHRYYRRPDAKKFFAVGRVFAILWHEGAGEKRGGHLIQAEPFNVQKNSETKGKYNEVVFSHIRRMAVVKARHGYCWCVPINTYNQQGVAKKGLSPEDRQAHSIIYMDDTKPALAPVEEGMMLKKPIAVTAANSEQKLHYMSRISFSKVYTVEWNVKVMNVGKVHRDSMFNFKGYWHNTIAL